ncbi:hypothetical protein TNCT_458411 [Trichonephila clavata]|uniref:Uncharacterized protein n=1 Tax=Trichonephila clavata TaxID=2740835 RepID=A0A8X6FRK1_TRICU|nr:hypothetical protein TNCT_458411 [Trichonephila clavata]
MVLEKFESSVVFPFFQGFYPELFIQLFIFMEIQENNDRDSKIVTKCLKSAWNRKKWRPLDNISPRNVDLISRVLFPSAFIIFSIIYGVTNV